MLRPSSLLPPRSSLLCANGSRFPVRLGTLSTTPGGTRRNLLRRSPLLVALACEFSVSRALGPLRAAPPRAGGVGITMALYRLRTSLVNSPAWVPSRASTRPVALSAGSLRALIPSFPPGELSSPRPAAGLLHPPYHRSCRRLRRACADLAAHLERNNESDSIWCARR